MGEERALIIFLLIALVVIAVVTTVSFIFMMSGAPFRGQARDFSSNGERIFFAGRNSRNAIDFRKGPPWFQMHGGGCVVCHGSDGRGGRVPMMGGFTAPDIRYKTLTMPHDDEPAFTNATIKRAITEGKESDGSDLSGNMPRWRMSDADLNDLIGFLKSLP
ncbi:MAG: cytochrome c [Actinobacteria bacterium]|nr:cytochrome c [Actinomycetota bacterium]